MNAPKFNEANDPSIERNRKPSLAMRVIRHMGTGAISLLHGLFHEKMSDMDKRIAYENNIITIRSKAHEINIFDERAIAPLSQDEVQKLLDEVLSAIGNSETMSDRFAIFNDTRYRQYFGSLMLGETQQPGSHIAMDSMKAEYAIVLQGLKDNELVADELDREDSKSSVLFGAISSDGFRSGERSRELVRYPDGEFSVKIAKRLTFLIEEQLYAKVSCDTDPLKPNNVTDIELLIDNEDAGIVPVRTVYYVCQSRLKS